MYRWLVALALFSSLSQAFEIPKGLSETDRLEIVRTLDHGVNVVRDEVCVAL